MKARIISSHYHISTECFRAAEKNKYIVRIVCVVSEHTHTHRSTIDIEIHDCASCQWWPSSVSMTLIQHIYIVLHENIHYICCLPTWFMQITDLHYSTFTHSHDSYPSCVDIYIYWPQLFRFRVWYHMRKKAFGRYFHLLLSKTKHLRISSNRLSCVFSKCNSIEMHTAFFQIAVGPSIHGTTS